MSTPRPVALQIRLTVEEKEAFERVAHLLGLPVSIWARMVLKQEVMKYAGEKLRELGGGGD